ncbi:hypothetical protein ACTXT7_002715 [Hymenolepis weldensis]
MVQFLQHKVAGFRRNFKIAGLSIRVQNGQMPKVSSDAFRTLYTSFEFMIINLDAHQLPSGQLIQGPCQNISLQNAQQNASSSNANRPVRYLAERRSLFCWLRGKDDVLLRTNSSGTSYVPFATLKGHDNSTACYVDSSDTSEATGVHQDLVSMNTSVRFAGLTLHIVEVEDNGLNTSASTVPGSWSQYRGKCPPVAIWTNSRQFQSILVHPRMLLDHFPDVVSSALHRIYSAYSQRGSPVYMFGSNGNALDAKGLIRRIKRTSQ